MSPLYVRFLVWIGGPVAILAGLVATWIFTNIPGLHVYGTRPIHDAVAKGIAAVIVFGIAALVTWLSHQRLVQHVLNVVEPLIVPILHSNGKIKLGVMPAHVLDRVRPVSKVSEGSGFTDSKFDTSDKADPPPQPPQPPPPPAAPTEPAAATPAQ